MTPPRFLKPLLLALLGAAPLALGLPSRALAEPARVEAAWARPTPPGAEVGGAFMTLIGGQTADRVVAVNSPVAAVVELHTHVMEGGIAKMRRIAGIDVPAAARVELKPGGLHIMLIQLKAPLKIGDIVPLTLRFEKAGAVDVKATVGAPAPGAMDRRGGQGAPAGEMGKAAQGGETGKAAQGGHMGNAAQGGHRGGAGHDSPAPHKP